MNGTPHDRARLQPAEWEAVEDTLAAYALRALPAEEATSVAQHFTICAACRESVSELRAAGSVLALAPEPVAPSPALKNRLLAAVEAEQRQAAAGPPHGPAPEAPAPPRDEGPAAGPTPARPDPAQPPPPIPLESAWEVRARRPAPWPSRWWWLPTAALLLLSLGLGVWNLRLQDQLRRPPATYELSGTPAAPNASGTLIRTSSSPPTLVLRDLPPLPPSQAYQVWYLRDGQPVSAQVLPAGAGGQQQVQLNQDLPGAQQVAVSVEPAGGSPSPTGAIVLAGSL